MYKFVLTFALLVDSSISICNSNSEVIEELRLLATLAVDGHLSLLQG